MGENFLKKPLIMYLRELYNCKQIEVFPTMTKTCGEQIVIGVAYDSRKVKEGYVFFCKGANFSLDYLCQAIENGAICVLIENNFIAEFPDTGRDVEVICVENINKSMAILANFHYDFPLEKIFTIAITGTKGKTTTVSQIKGILGRCEGVSVATASDYINSSLTTPEAIDFFEAAAICREKGVTHLVCEISSQAQKMSRTYGINFDIACFTNFALDHISPTEHSDIEDYFLAKMSLFDQCKMAILNLDYPESRRIIEQKINKIPIKTYSFQDKTADFVGFDCESRCEGGFFKMNDREKGEFLQLCVGSFGDFNMENALSAATVCRILGAKKSDIFLGLLLTKTGGRMEIFESADGKITIIVDYAHNGLSFSSLFETVLNRYPCTEIRTIFGCPGGKSLNRRVDLPSIASQFSQKIFLCEDDSGCEQFSDIIEDIISSGKLKNGTFEVIKSRKEALYTAFCEAVASEKKSVLLFVGKGNEKTMKTQNGAIAYESDTEIAREIIEKYNEKLDPCTVFAPFEALLGSRMCVTLPLGISRNQSALYYLCEDIKILLKSRVKIILVCHPNDEFFLSRVLIEKQIYSKNDSVFRAENRPKNYGELQVLNSVNTSLLALQICAKTAIKNLVFFTEGDGLQVGDGVVFPRLSFESVEVIYANISSESAEFFAETINAVRSGVECVGILNCNHKNNLAFFATGYGYKGTIIS